MPRERFSIAQVTPYPWEQHHEVNRFVERLSDELCARGHRVVVVAPSDSRELIRESREVVKRCATTPTRVFAGDGCAQVLGVGQSIPFPSSRRSGPVSLPVDVSRTIEDLFDHAEFDFVHVHEPFAPSAASAALRHSHALNVGSFHGAGERVLSTQVARRLVELLFGRLDGRTASFKTTRDLMQRFFPGDYRVIAPGRRPGAARRRPARPRGRRDRLRRRGGALGAAAVPARAAQAAARPALGGDDLGAPARRSCRTSRWRARSATACASSAPRTAPTRSSWRARRSSSPRRTAPRPRPQHAAARDGRRRGAGRRRGCRSTRRRSTTASSACCSSRATPRRWPGSSRGWSATATCARRCASACARRHDELTWSRVADEFEELYGEIAARRHDTDGQAGRAQAARRSAS